MAVTAQVIVDRSLETLNDEGAKFFTEAEILSLVQEGYDESYLIARPRIKKQIITQVAKLTYYDLVSLIPDYLHIVAIWNPQLTDWMDFTSLVELDNLDDKWELTDGEPKFFSVIDFKYMVLYPRNENVVSETLDIYYKSTAPGLSLGTEIDITDFNEDILENYAVASGLSQLEEFAKASSYFNDYNDGLTQLIQLLQNRESKDLRLQLAEVDVL